MEAWCQAPTAIECRSTVLSGCDIYSTARPPSPRTRNGGLLRWKRIEYWNLGSVRSERAMSGRQKMAVLLTGPVVNAELLAGCLLRRRQISPKTTTTTYQTRHSPPERWRGGTVVLMLPLFGVAGGLFGTLCGNSRSDEFYMVSGALGVHFLRVQGWTSARLRSRSTPTSRVHVPESNCRPSIL